MLGLASLWGTWMGPRLYGLPVERSCQDTANVEYLGVRNGPGVSSSALLPELRQVSALRSSCVFVTGQFEDL